MGVRNGGQEGALAPPPPPSLAGQNSMFFDLFSEKYVAYFLVLFRQISCFCPPGKCCPPLEKSLRTPMHEGGGGKPKKCHLFFEWPQITIPLVLYFRLLRDKRGKNRFCFIVYERAFTAHLGIKCACKRLFFSQKT